MLKGLGQLGDMAKLMKQAQDMQSKMTDIQKQLEELDENYFRQFNVGSEI